MRSLVNSAALRKGGRITAYVARNVLVYTVADRQQNAGSDIGWLARTLSLQECEPEEYESARKSDELVEISDYTNAWVRK